MAFFVTQWAVLLGGWALHVYLDRQVGRRTGERIIELALLWIMVVGGAWAIVRGFSHVGPMAHTVAADAGYAPSPYQWEVGWADIAVGVLGIGCAWRRLRGSWLTAAVVALVILFGGAASGHIMQLVAHDNRTAGNIWQLVTDILKPLLAVLLLVAYRRTPLGRDPRQPPSRPRSP